MIYFGKIEDRFSDPARNMRYKVRVIGVHNPLKSELSTDDLPWATPIQDNSAAMSGIGHSANGYLNGSTVAVIFLDEDKQIPLILGAIAGVLDKPYTGSELYDSINADLSIIPPEYPPVIPDDAYIGPLNKGEIDKIISLIAKLRGNNASRSTPFGLGKYQHTNEELGYLGYINDKLEWLGKNKINSKEQYLSTPNEQTDAEEVILKLYYTAVCKLGATSFTPKEKFAGLLVACHVGGVSPLNELLSTGRNYNNSISDNLLQFYKEGYKLIAGKSTEEVPSYDNINSTASDKYEENGSTSKSKYDVNPSEKSVSNQGFTDPFGKYPLVGRTNEPDTPRLASGIKVTETILGLKESVTVKSIPIANSSIIWKQSPQPYNAIYPYNNVYQSESGHVMEFDDTPGSERIHIAHKSGTFNEVDAEGNQVERTIGIRTIIVDKDELVYVKGSGHVTIDGDMSLKVSKALNVEITGNANVKVSGDYNLDVGGTFRVSSSSFEIGGSNGRIASDVLKLNASNIIQNPATGDILFLEHTGNSDSVASGITEYSPSITLPAPFTRHERQGIELEETNESKRLAGPTVPVKSVQEDKTSSKSTPSVVHPIIPLNDTISYMTRLSANYKVRDVCVGDLGKSFPFMGQHGLTAKDIAENLRYLCLNVLEPLRTHWQDKGFVLNSCIRPGGNPFSLPGRISQHELGMAADISFRAIRGMPNDREQFFDIAVWIKDNILFDQLLLEYRNGGSVWIHISFNKSNNRRQVKTMNNDSTYSSGLVLLA